MFAKLLNSLFGKNQPAKSSKPSATKRAHTGTRKLAKPTTPKSAPSQQSDPSSPGKQKAAGKQKSAGKRSMLDFVSRGPHGSLCRMIKKSSATSVLEIGVGDGSRALAVLATLAKSQPTNELKYIAVDLFEMGDGELTLKQFHQQIRSIDIKPNLIPMPTQAGLARVAHTFGAVDLVLIADQQVDARDPLFTRVTHPGSRILCWDGQNWQQIDRKTIAGRGNSEAA